MLRTTATSIVTALIAASAVAQTAPERSNTAPELLAGCPIPTLAECQDNDYLTEDRCGILQAQNDWTCANLLEAEFRAQFDGQEELSIIAKNITPTGVDYVVKMPAPQVVSTYTPDLYSISSQNAARDFASDLQIGVDVYEFWDADGPVVGTCREYVYEKFYDINIFQRILAFRHHDYRELFEMAYGPGYLDWSIGTRHINSPTLRGKDWRGFGALFTGASRPKNTFFDIPAQPSLKGRPPVQGAPALTTNIYFHSFIGALALAKIAQNHGTVSESWQWHKQMSETLSVEGSVINDFILLPPQADPNPWENLQVAPQDDDELDQLLGNTGGPDPIRRRFDKELDELFDLQQRFRGLIREWAQANERFEGSGWTHADLRPDPPDDEGPDPQGIQQLVANNGGGGGGGFSIQANNGGGGGGGGMQLDIDAIKIESPETVVRRRILDEMVTILIEAAAEGCLEKGLTACDWSTKLFGRSVMHDFSDDQDKAFEKCNEYVPVEFSQIENLDIPVVDEPDNSPLSEFNCTIATGSTITAAGLEQLWDKVDECRQKRAEWEEAKAVLAAQAKVRAIPELVDPATGEFKLPGIDRGGGEDKGNEFFGLFFDWGFGFGVELNSEICQVDAHAGGHFLAGARVFGFDINLIDALANVDTVELELKLHARIAGKNLFNPVDIDFPAMEPLDFDVTKNVGSGKKDQTLVDTIITLGPIPLGIAAGISGEVGFNLGLNVYAENFNNMGCPSAQIGGLAEPYLSISGFLEAGINIVVARAGVRGSIVIIKTSLPFTAGVGLALQGGQPPQIDMTINTRLALELTTLAGYIALYAQLGWCPFCVKGELPLAEWDGLVMNIDIFEQTYFIDLTSLITALFSG